jgi:hypothetical protein
LDEVYSCPQNEVIVPVQGYFLVGIQEFTFNISYIPENVIFTGISNLNPQLEQMIVQVFNEPDPYIQFTWTSSTPVSLVDGVQFDLHFDYNSNTSDLDFIEGSYVLSEIETLETVFQNGSIIQNIIPEVINQPEDMTVFEGEEAEFSLLDQNGQQYQWFVSSDSGSSWNTVLNDGQYFGAQSPVLQMYNVPGEWNANTYYCQIFSEYCVVDSDTVTLLVDTLVGMQEVYHEQTNPLSMHLSSITSENVFLEAEVSNGGELFIRIFDSFGEMLNDRKYNLTGKGKHEISIPNSSNLHGMIIILGYFQEADDKISSDYIKVMIR